MNQPNTNTNTNDTGNGPYGASGGLSSTSGGNVAIAPQPSHNSPLQSPVQNSTASTQGAGGSDSHNGGPIKTPVLNQEQLQAFFAAQWQQLQPHQQPQQLQQQPPQQPQQAFSPQLTGLAQAPAGPSGAWAPPAVSSQAQTSFQPMQQQQQQQQQAYNTFNNNNFNGGNNNATASIPVNNNSNGGNGANPNEHILAMLIQQKVQQVQTQMPGTNNANANVCNANNDIANYSNNNLSANGNNNNNNHGAQEATAMQAAVASALTSILQQQGSIPQINNNNNNTGVNPAQQQPQQQFQLANIIQGLLNFGSSVPQQNNTGGSNTNNFYPALQFQQPPAPATQIPQQQQPSAMNPAPQDIFTQALQLLGQQPQLMQQQQQQQPIYQIQQPPQQQQQQQQQQQHPIQANNFLQSLSAIFGAANANIGFQPVPAATAQEQQPQQQPFLQPQMQYSQQPQQQELQLQPQPPQVAAAPMVPPSSIDIPSSAVPPPHPDLVAPLKRKRGRVSTFPQKLHQMLRDLEAEGKTNIASFVYEGRAFMIHDAKAFVEHCIPKYFKMTSLSSFQRQLNLYDFHRIHDGPHQGAYFHRLFIQGHAVLSTKMVRNKIIRKPKPKKRNNKKKAAEASEDEEDESEVEADEEDEQTSSNGGRKSTKAVSDGSSSPSNSTKGTRNGTEQI